MGLGKSIEAPWFVGVSTGISHYILIVDKIIGLEVGVAVGDLEVGVAVGDLEVGVAVGNAVGVEVGLAVGEEVGGIDEHSIEPMLRTVLFEPILLETRDRPSVILRKIAGSTGGFSVVVKVGVTMVGMTLS